MWPFRPKPKPLNPGKINEDWAYGDLAECIRAPADGLWFGVQGPCQGDVLRVERVSPGRDAIYGIPGWFLGFARVRHNFAAECFRKVPPLNSECDAEFAAEIKRLGKQPVGTPA